MSGLNPFASEEEKRANTRKFLLSALPVLSKILKPHCEIEWRIDKNGDVSLSFTRIAPGAYLNVVFYHFIPEEELIMMVDQLKSIIKKDLYPSGNFNCSKKEDMIKFINQRDELCKTKTKT